jgi:ketosteroid isomerase-like protein
MPWFPDFVGAVELVRRKAIAESQADPIGQYLIALEEGDPDALESVWPGDVVVYDPRAGRVRGHRQLSRFISTNKVWLAAHDARTETVASTVVDGRAVVEMLAYLTADGREFAWPVAVVAESHDERKMTFRTYCSQWPVDGRRHLRPAILPAADGRLGDVVGRYHEALDAGDADEVAGTFTGDGYFREPIGPPTVYRGAREIRAFFADRFRAGGGGITLQHCAVTDDGLRCAVEYNCVRWGSHQVQPQAGIAIYQRGPDNRLAAARVYDDIEAPAAAQTDR